MPLHRIILPIRARIIPERAKNRKYTDMWWIAVQVYICRPLFSFTSLFFVTGQFANHEYISIEQWISDTGNSSTSSPPKRSWFSLYDEMANPLIDEPAGVYQPDQFRPTTRSYFHLIPTCVELYIEHIYPIMPLVYIPTLRAAMARELTPSEKNLVYALCALTSTHMSGKSIQARGPESWDAAGVFFLDECISNRRKYDFVEDHSLWAVISSYLISSAFFELNQSRKTWYYLREAITLGQDIGLHDESSYGVFDPSESLCRRRTFWILYVTERSFAILRHKPLSLSSTPDLPTTIHDYESPEIHAGFKRLIQSFHLLNSSFVDSWNQSSSTPQSTQTYTLLQADLNNTPATQSLTSIQKADILITQQWLRLIVWQSSMRQGLVSANNEIESMTFSYPLKIAYSLLGVISSLPGHSIEVHGMGILEKIFEIGNAMMDVMQACGSTGYLRAGFAGAAVSVGRGGGVWTDPFEIFIRTLSCSPNSQRQYANLLLAKAREKPEVMRFSGGVAPALTPPRALAPAGQNGVLPAARDNISIGIEDDVQNQKEQQWRGRVIGEVTDGTSFGGVVDLVQEPGPNQTQQEPVDSWFEGADILDPNIIWNPAVETNDNLNTNLLGGEEMWPK